jgi:hypothetical protein
MIQGCSRRARLYHSKPYNVGWEGQKPKDRAQNPYRLFSWHKSMVKCLVEEFEYAAPFAYAFVRQKLCVVLYQGSEWDGMGQKFRPMVRCILSHPIPCDLLKNSFDPIPSHPMGSHDINYIVKKSSQNSAIFIWYSWLNHNIIFLHFTLIIIYFYK